MCTVGPKESDSWAQSWVSGMRFRFSKLTFKLFTFQGSGNFVDTLFLMNFYSKGKKVDELKRIIFQSPYFRSFLIIEPEKL